MDFSENPQAHKSIWMENRVLPEGYFFALIAEETQNESFHDIIWEHVGNL